MICGRLAGGDYGIRVARPGYDAFAEPFGSRNISFDSRVSDIGTVVAAGLATCGGAPISFPAMPYIPICKIQMYDGNLWSDWLFQNAAGGVASVHSWIPAIAIVDNASLRVVAYTNSNYSPPDYFSPYGMLFHYSVFASEA